MNNPLHRTLETALRGYYAPKLAGTVSLDRAALIEVLGKLPALSGQAHNDSILSQLNQHYPGINLGIAEQAIIMFIDDGLSKILKQVDMEFRVEALIRNLAPLLAIEALANDVHTLRKPLKIYDLLDAIMQYCAGWSEDLGVLGETYIEKAEFSLAGINQGKDTPSEALTKFKQELKSEHRRQLKLEENLIQAESNRLVQDGAKRAAAELLNQHMAGQSLALFIIFMLQGAWFELVQKIQCTYGGDSAEWKQISRLTHDLIEAMQPETSGARQKALFAELPGQINEFLKQLSFDTTFVEPCLGDIEAEFEAIAEGNPSMPCDFEPMETTKLSGIDGDIESTMLKKVANLEPGGWFLYDDKKDSDEKIARIKLIINHEASARLVFTNQNRRKVLTMSYTEFAARLSSGTIRSLEPDFHMADFMNRHLGFIVGTIKAQKARELKEKEAKQRKEISRQFLSRQQVRITDELQQLKQRAALKKKRAELLQQKAQKKLDAAKDAVERLRPDAWVKLPLMEGTQTPCKLVGVVSAADKYIFANRAGIKVAEYTAGQLSQMIVTENSEILDTGAEFEQVLASVVTGLRENREKSYDQLTGSA